MKLILVIGILAGVVSLCWAQCVPSQTTVSGSRAPGQVCSGALIFEDNFNNLDEGNWRHENTLAGGGNWEFQWYVKDRYNSYADQGALHIRPQFTSTVFGEGFLSSGRVIIPPNECTAEYHFGCDRQGTPQHIINPIRSASLTTWNSFSYKFGTLEIRAKMPAGDWLWPALWLMPRQSVYGQWPRSGEIDLMEMRGNRNLRVDGGNIGVEQAACSTHFGPSAEVKNPWYMTHGTKNRYPGWDQDFHLYRLVWTPNGLQFFYDNELIQNVNPGSGFWDMGNFGSSGMQNPWAGATNMAPFDQEFYIIMNLAVGGMTGWFQDDWENSPHPKPWNNDSPNGPLDFWSGRWAWEPTWNLHNQDSHLQIDYVRVWAL